MISSANSVRILLSCWAVILVSLSVPAFESCTRWAAWSSPPPRPPPRPPRRSSRRSGTPSLSAQPGVLAPQLQQFHSCLKITERFICYLSGHQWGISQHRNVHRTTCTLYSNVRRLERMNTVQIPPTTDYYIHLCRPAALTGGTLFIKLNYWIINQSHPPMKYPGHQVHAAHDVLQGHEAAVNIWWNLTG